MNIRTYPICFLILFVFLGRQGGLGDDFSEKVRSSLKKYQSAVVPIKLVIKMKMGKQEQEKKMEVTGTMIDSSGLSVVSAFSIDPAAVYNSYQTERGRGPSNKSDVESEIAETLIILNDGTEVESEVLLKDMDLDLAFIRPKNQERKYDFVPMPEHPPELQLLDDLFVINRLGPTEDRTPIVGVGKVRAIVKGPRTYYICDDDISRNLGCLVFKGDGVAVGIFVAKKSQTLGNFSSGFSSVPIAVMRPIEEVLDVAKEVKEASVARSKSTSP